MAEEQLTATIIGSGSPVYNENRASASVLVSLGNTQILVDMGNGTQANLYKLGINIRKLSALLFTHHHLDKNNDGYITADEAPAGSPGGGRQRTQ